jgi:Tol biopolymer transport system component
VAVGVAPALSPNGRLLAYATSDTDPSRVASCSSRLVVRDLGSGQERTWTPETNGSDELSVILRISWAPDSRHLVFERSYGGSEVRVLDTARNGTLSEATTQLEADGSDDSQRSPTWVDGDRVILALACCSDEYHPDANRVASVSMSTGAVQTIASSGGSRINEVAADSTGQHVIYVTDDGDMVMVDVGGSRIPIPGQFIEVDW